MAVPPNVTLYEIGPRGDTALRFVELKVQVEVHVQTAFVTLDAGWVAGPGSSGGLRLDVPTPGQDTAVSAVDVRLGEASFVTTVVPNEEAAKVAQGQGEGANKEAMRYNPNVFSLPIPGASPGTAVRVKITYFQPLVFNPNNGCYEVRVPTSVPAAQFPEGRPVQQWLSIAATINSVVPFALGYQSHPMLVPIQTPQSAQLLGNAGVEWPNCADFQVAFSVWGAAISGACYVAGALPGNPDTRNSFCCFVAPPTPKEAIVYSRRVFFLLDISGSMYGKPLEAAAVALEAAVRDLTPHDYFNICVFDDTQQMYAPEGIIPGAPDNVEKACAWIRNLKVNGLTDIMSPVKHAYQVLCNAQLQAPGGLPQIVLVTDGAVNNERDICHFAQEMQKDPVGKQVRISCVGIGGYCNSAFLRILAGIGRGFCDIALDQGTIETKMARIMQAIARPVLTDVQLQLPSNLQGVEIFPNPVPDLFSGAPICISGKFHGMLPGTIVARGTWTASGAFVDVPCQVHLAQNVPLDKVFIKQRLDYLIAAAWLTEDEGIRREIVALSVQENVPCAHTSMVAVQPTNAQAEKDLRDPAKPRSSGVLAAACVGGLAGIVIVGAATGQFGDVGATVSNLPTSFIDGALTFGGLADGLVDVGGNVISILGDGASIIGDGVVDGAEAVGGFFGNAFSDTGYITQVFTGNFWEGIGGSLANAVGSVGETAGVIFGNAMDAVGGCCSGVAEMGGNICGAPGECIGGCCEFVGNGLEDGISCLCGIVEALVK